MNNQTNPKKSELRSKLLLLYHQDGILDLVVGTCLLLLTLVMAFDQGAFIGLIGIPAIFYIPFKDQIALPRIGLIRFEKTFTDPRSSHIDHHFRSHHPAHFRSDLRPVTGFRRRIESDNRSKRDSDLCHAFGWHAFPDRRPDA